MGVLLHRTLLIQACLCIPMAALWYWTEEILLSLGQPDGRQRMQNFIIILKNGQ